MWYNINRGLGRGFGFSEATNSPNYTVQYGWYWAAETHDKCAGRWIIRDHYP